MVWMNSDINKFSIKQFYVVLELRVVVSFPTRVVLKSWVLSKVNFFAWEALWGKVLTLDQLQKHRWSLVNRCFLCKEDEQFIDHILLHCSLVRILWKLLFGLFGIH